MKFIKQNITNKTLYTKHFYAESQRLASKLGAGLASSIVDPTQFQVTEVCSSYEEKSDSLLQMLARGWDCAEIEPGNVSIENPELQVINDLAEVSADEPESDIFFYHSDHLGSSSWITDAGGDVNQHLQYLPFGEDYIYQRNTSWNIPYTFSGKEKDAETGYSYFGARYYDSDVSVWLSVDPLSDKYPSMSAYMYTAGNPVMLVDPDGRKIKAVNKEAVEIIRSALNKYKDKLGNSIINFKTYNSNEGGTIFEVDKKTTLKRIKKSAKKAGLKKGSKGYNEVIAMYKELSADHYLEVGQITTNSYNPQRRSGPKVRTKNKIIREFLLKYRKEGDKITLPTQKDIDELLNKADVKVNNIGFFKSRGTTTKGLILINTPEEMGAYQVPNNENQVIDFLKIVHKINEKNNEKN